MEGNWTISNLTPLERPEGITQLAITAADAARLKAAYLDPPGSPNQPDDPGLDRNRSFEPIRGQLRSSLIIDPKDGKIPWKDDYKAKPASLRRSVLNAFDNPQERPPLERCVGSTAATANSLNPNYLGPSKGPYFCLVNHHAITNMKYRRAHHKWSARFVSRSVQNRKFCPQPPRTALRRSGKRMTLHDIYGVPESK
jgi:hypothetical protein